MSDQDEVDNLAKAIVAVISGVDIISALKALSTVTAFAIYSCDPDGSLDARGVFDRSLDRLADETKLNS